MQTNSPLFTPGTLSDRIRQQTQYALSCGALHPILTNYEIIEDRGIPFLVRIISNLARKEAQKRKQQVSSESSKPVNPFLPCDRNLFLTNISPTHHCLLNKYNVVGHHILIVTRDFEPQDNWLTLADFQALWFALAEIDGLGFYNGGTDAGASQPHKHLQLVPLPLIPEGIAIPIETVFDSKSPQSSPYQSHQLPFPHAIRFFDPEIINSPENAAQVSLNCYYQLLRHVGRLEQDNPGIQQTGAYNLLITRRWMMVIPRSQDSWHSISVNSLGFAGALLVRDAQKLAQLKKVGLMNLLQQVSGL
ncbi:phosphorylase [Roseofilum reptotaenium CS-1145]|uniref:Phosphorylase n=1 Tax=Roseofilum reptotaenium AO1-A TaxID=1925591 RepID=A0A1L9QLS7_9CYAN|nr:phosphorylase [Roseofilum reptotaenium]MDB9516025.1 phosphorylase [Roseofilum reptotaenium CS-1145]OJJ20658.1 phosphorylase [Roseofilum reptotaenium AO1-A]